MLARDDDVINVAGHRLSTSAIEEVSFLVSSSLRYEATNKCNNYHMTERTHVPDVLVFLFLPSFSSVAFSQVVLRHPLVIDCAVVGVSDKLKGQMPLGLVVTRGEVCSP